MLFHEGDGAINRFYIAWVTVLMSVKTLLCVYVYDGDISVNGLVICDGLNKVISRINLLDLFNIY